MRQLHERKGVSLLQLMKIEQSIEVAEEENHGVVDGE